MQLSMGEVAAILGTSCDTPERIAQGFSIDSRTIQPGQVFFAIRGPHLDGHQFIKQALEHGATGAVVERSFREEAGSTLSPALLAVRDTAEALQQLARVVRKKWARSLIAVTGS